MGEARAMTAGKILLGVVVGYFVLCAVAAVAMGGSGSALVFVIMGLLGIGVALQRGVIGGGIQMSRKNSRFFILPLNLPIAVCLMLWWATKLLWRALAMIYHALAWLAQGAADLVRAKVTRADPVHHNVVPLRRR
jgi:hypothetical protein